MIYLIDDHMPQNGEINFDKYETCLKTYKLLPCDEDDMLWQDEDAIFFYHSSLEEAYVISDFINKYNVPFIAFSGALNDKPEEFSNGWSMQRSTFYFHLKFFLDRFKIDNNLSIKSFFDNDTCPTITVQEHIGDERDEKIICLTDQFLSQYPVNINRPLEVEEFVKTHFKGKEVIVFDLNSERLTPTVVHYLGAYIRLSLDTIKEVALAPFIFLGEKDFIDYINEFQETECQDILIWAGSIFRNDKDKDIFKDIPVLTPADYINKFLKNLKISPKGITGNHTIANYWGAYVIARHIAGFEVRAKEIYLKALEKDALYLKYLIADRIRSIRDITNILNGSGETVEFDVEPLQLNWHPKVLLVDDQDDIWTEVIHALMPGADLTVIGKNNKLINSDMESGFLTSEANRILDTREFDLILLDLRLGGVLEESIVNGDDCSGMKILRRITDKNPGQQVIMFTSSNKAWNLKKALTMAAGYYIKESPLQPFNEDETLQNLEDFLTTVESCLEYKDLKDIVRDIQTSEDVEFRDEYRDPEEKSEEVRRQLGIVKTMALSQSREVGDRGRNWTYVYIALFQVLEIIKRLSPDFQPTNPGNIDNNQNRFLVNLIVNMLPPEERQAYRTYLRGHNGLRSELVHRETRRFATYEEFMNLWVIVYHVLRRLGYPLK